MEFFEKHHRAEPQEPQLAAMIDVFSILIIFLIAGTVMGTSAIVLPQGAKLPESFSKETLDTAPQITIESDKISFSFDAQPYTLESLRAGGAEVERLKIAVKKHLSESGLKTHNALHVIADKDLPYSLIFESIKFAREAGIQSVYFVSTVSGKTM